MACIASGIDAFGIFNLLGAHVSRRAEQCAGAGFGAHSARHIHHFGNAKIQHFGEVAALFGADEKDVVGLEIAVNDAVCVRKL